MNNGIFQRSLRLGLFAILGLCLSFGALGAKKTSAKPLVKTSGKTVEAARGLASRIIPGLANQIIFEEFEAPVDSFLISQRKGKLLIQGSSPLAMAVGLNNYLRRDLGVSVSWFASDPIQAPDKIVLPTGQYGGKAAANDRFFLNYCTFGYTMPYWNWTDWERFIDWMALNGINLPLAMTGQEKAWYLTWKKIGLSDEEILGSFTGPAHLPWHWMNNVDHFQGPLSLSWLDSQERLQRRILNRERELGMRPVLAAFAGHAPVALKQYYPDANITLRSDWAHFPDEDRCYFLDPSDKLYGEVQKTYLAIQDSLFGTDHIYGIDPFNEQDSPDWSEEFLKGASAGIFKTLREADPQAKWLQMTWNFYYDRKNWTKPRMKAFLDGVPGDDMLLLDYFCDADEVWRLNDSYFGKPYLWCYLGNFGGNTMMAGNIKDVDKKIAATFKEGGKNLAGVGGTLEGFDVNPVMHEYVLAKAWNPDLSASEWVDIWANSRGGKTSSNVKEGWKILADSVYIDRAKIGQASLTNARPTFKERTGFYTVDNHKFTDSSLKRVLDLFLSAENVDDNRAYQFDVMNVTRQLLGNRFTDLRNEFAEAYQRGEVLKAKESAAEMDELLIDLDELLSTVPDFNMSKWIEDARSHGTSKEEADLYERNARTLLTIWSPPDLQLNDYGNRQWSGLMKSFYRERWKKFTDAVIAAMENNEEFNQPEVIADIKRWEGEWIDKKDKLTPISSRRPSDLARNYRMKYNLFP